METEVHVYALSIAASVLLSFFPFMIVMVSLSRYVFHSRLAEETIYLTLRDFFPGDLGNFIDRNLSATIRERGPFRVLSVFLLLFTANGIFEPLEVALNRAWGVVKNRSYVKNQFISLGLIFVCGTLSLMSVGFTALNRQYLTQAGWAFPEWTILPIFKVAAIPLSILALFLVFWLLPNRKVPPRAVLPYAILVGLALEALKYFNLITWPWLASKLYFEYGPFFRSVTILLWSFLAAMIVLAGAEWSAREARARSDAEEES
jgi:YihY family inner membrane protein